jgi:hypothetical protein
MADGLAPLIEGATELRGVAHPDAFREGEQLLLVRGDRDAFAAFGATETQNVAAARGGHARTKAVGAETAFVVRLECTLHDRILRLFV